MLSARTVLVMLAVLWPFAAEAQSLRRSSVWDLKLGQPVADQPGTQQFRAFACGSNGGPPRQQLTGWADFARCRAEPNGLYEVYFEYDDELEYIARARDLEREISRWAGTTEVSFPVVVSALFNRDGILKGVRLVTDARPDHRNDVTEANVRKRPDFYVLGGVLAARHNMIASRDCVSQPPAEGESSVGDTFIKQQCEVTDTATKRKIALRVNYFRKPGQSGFNPQLPTQLTEGQFESSTHFEMFQLD